MKTALALLPLTALIAACGGGTPDTLPTDPIERAATCGAVAAAGGRTGVAIADKMPIAGQGATLRPALVAASESGSWDSARTTAIVEALPKAGEALDEARVKTLTPQCAQAFPTPATVTLPDNELTAALGCDELGDFMRRVLEGQPEGYRAETDRYFALNRALDDRIAPLFNARGLGSQDVREAEAKKAMAAIVKTGEPSAVLDACYKRFADG